MWEHVSRWSSMKRVERNETHKRHGYAGAQEESGEGRIRELTCCRPELVIVPGKPLYVYVSVCHSLACRGVYSNVGILTWTRISQVRLNPEIMASDRECWPESCEPRAPRVSRTAGRFTRIASEGKTPDLTFTQISFLTDHLAFSHLYIAMRFAALSVLSGVVLFSLDVAAQAYNWSITDQSPLITYNPLRVGDNTTTWNSTYSNSSWADQQLAGYSSLVGHGQSAHTTDFAGATASVGFVGTAVYVWGQAFQLSSVLYVDGVSRSFSGGQDGIIGSVEGLTNGWHEVEVNVRGLGFVQVEGFTFTSDIGR